MLEILNKILLNLKNFFLSLDQSKKIATVATIFIAIGGLAIISAWALKTRYEVLYTDLNKEDGKKIAIFLEENKISYQLEDKGKTIKIPKEMIEIWRLKLATMGVSFSGTIGYEVFDKQSFGTTTFVQKVNKQRALEGELVKTIKFIQGVKRARVHLNIPENSPFISEKKLPSASVVLDLNRGVLLTEKEIKGVASLVSSAVEGMRNENVVIIDGRGKRLSENIGDPMTMATASRLTLESKLNRQYEVQVEDILTKVVGEGKVIAKVSVVMDFTEKVSEQRSYDGENKTAISEVINSQKLNGSRPSPQGYTGARSNLPGETPLPKSSETKNNVDKNLTTRNYNVPSVLTKSRKPAAVVKNISVAVMIDGKEVPSLDENGKPILDKDGKQVLRYEKWSKGDITNFKQVVSSALGINLTRGDNIVIKNMEFAKQDLDAIELAMRESEQRVLIKNIFKYITVGLAISLFFALIIRPFIQWITDNTVESVEDFLPKTLEELEKVQANQKLPGLEDALPQIEEKLNPEKIESDMIREKIVSLIESNPSKAAQIVHNMIHKQDLDKQIS